MILVKGAGMIQLLLSPVCLGSLYCKIMKSACNFADGNHDEIDDDINGHCHNLHSVLPLSSLLMSS